VGTSVIPIGHGKYGGIEKLCYDFVEGLHRLGHQITVAAPRGSRVPEGVKLIETVKLPDYQDRDDITDKKLIPWLVPNIDIDAIHDFSHKHVLKERVFPSIHMVWHPITHYYLFQSNYNAVCLSNWQKERFEKAYVQKAIVMPMCVDTDKYRPVDNPSRERFLFLGKISPEKGVHLAIQYCRELGAGLDVVGGLIPSELNSSYLQSIQKLCEGDNIKLYFNVTEEEKIGFLQNAKAVIYPVQQDEAHWLVGIEAWACMTDTYTFDRGAMREICLPRTVAKTEEEFKELMQTEGYYHREQIWAHGQQYNLGVVLPKYLELYKLVAEGKRW